MNKKNKIAKFLCLDKLFKRKIKSSMSKELKHKPVHVDLSKINRPFKGVKITGEISKQRHAAIKHVCINKDIFIKDLVRDLLFEWLQKQPYEFTYCSWEEWQKKNNNA